MLIEMFKMKSAEQNGKCWTKLLVGKKCFISNLLIKNAERRENGVKARVKKTDAARISIFYSSGVFKYNIIIVGEGGKGGSVLIRLYWAV